jgi:hypothetical protein
LIREDVEVDENTTDPILATSFGNYTYDVVNTCNYFIVHPDRCHSLVLYDDSSNNNETTAAVDDSPRYGYEECPVSCRACPYGTCRDAHPFVDEIRGTFNVKVITVIEPEVEGEPATRTITNATGVSCDWAAAKDVESRCNFRILEPPPLPNEGAADGDEVITKFVKDECPVTCGSCPTLSPTVSPSLSPTERCNAETEVEIEILLKTNNEPQQISWRIDVPTAATEEVENAVVRYARKGSYSRPNTEEREYVCLKYDTDYRFKIWSDTTDGGNNDDDDKVMYMATYVDNPTTTDSIFLNQDRFDEKRTEKFRTRSKE